MARLLVFQVDWFLYLTSKLNSLCENMLRGWLSASKIGPIVGVKYVPKKVFTKKVKKWFICLSLNIVSGKPVLDPSVETGLRPVLF